MNFDKIKKEYLEGLKRQYNKYINNRYALEKQLQYALGIGSNTEIKNCKDFIEANMATYEIDKAKLMSITEDRKADLKIETVKIHKKLWDPAE
jgi:hypothetical protein